MASPEFGSILGAGPPSPERAEDFLLARALAAAGALPRDALEAALREGSGLESRLRKSNRVAASRLEEAQRAREKNRIASYEILELLARGGMADVFLALETRLRRIVALKLLREEVLTERRLARFRREALAAARLSHPGIAAVYEAGSAGDRHYVAMEFIEGGTLRDRLGRIDLPEAVRIIEEAARAVHHAHEHGVIHRDVKPGNILLDREGRPRVTDFGLARLMSEESNLTISGEVCGTPHYMAPEQVKGEVWKISPRTDVYGLGTSLFESVAGRPPFVETDQIRLYQRIVREDPPRPSALNSGIDPALDAVILKALEKDPAQRYPSALELADDLRRWRGGEAVQARRPGAWSRVWRRITRHDDELRDAKALYESLVENLPQMVFRKDNEGRITFANRRYCTVLGKSLEELMGKTDFDLFPRQLAEKYRADDQRVMGTGQIFDTEEDHALPDGTRIIVQVVKSPLYDARGQLIGVQGIFWEIADKRMGNLTTLTDTDVGTGVLSRSALEAVLPLLLDAAARAGERISIRFVSRGQKPKEEGLSADLRVLWDERSVAVLRIGSSSPRANEIFSEPGETAAGFLVRASRGECAAEAQRRQDDQPQRR